MTYKLDTIKVTQLIIDHIHNPRHKSLEDEPAAISQLYKAAKVLPLAKHIAKHGLNPLERMAVVKHPLLPNFYIALEGNRRTCALKLLKDPKRGPDSKAQKDLAMVAATAVAVPSRVDVVIFDERPSAREWLKLKHRGIQGGIGTIQWNVSQNTKFDEQGGGAANPNAQALALLDYAEQVGLLPKEKRGDVSLTTMTRYLSTPAVRAAVGLVNGRDLMRNAPPDQFERALGRIVNDLLPQDGKQPVLTSRTHLRAKDRAEYAEKVSNDGDGVSTRLPAPELADATQRLPRPTPSAGRNSKHPGDRRSVVKSDFRLTHKNAILRRIFEELKTVDPSPNAFPFSANYLLRAFIEQVVLLYAKKSNAGHNGELHAVTLRCIEKLEKDGVEGSVLKPLRTHASEKHHWSSVHTLGAGVHGAGVPKEESMKALWDSIQPALEAMLARS